jgi:hypothetical protein
MVAPQSDYMPWVLVLDKVMVSFDPINHIYPLSSFLKLLVYLSAVFLYGASCFDAVSTFSDKIEISSLRRLLCLFLCIDLPTAEEARWR